MERSPALYLLITLFSFYLLVPSSAVPPPLSRLQKTMPMQEAGQLPPVKGTLEPEMETARIVPEDDESIISERMAFETQDYGPPVPNNHHKPPGWR